MDFSVKRKTEVALRGASAKEVSREALLAKVAEDRAARNQVKKQQAAALTIQRYVRGRRAAQKASDALRCEWDLKFMPTQALAEPPSNHLSNSNGTSYSLQDIWEPSRPIQSTCVLSAEGVTELVKEGKVWELLRPLLVLLRSTKWQKADEERLSICLTVLLKSVEITDPAHNFCGPASSQTASHRSTWQLQSRRLFTTCCTILLNSPSYKPGLPLLAVRTMVALTDRNSWKCLHMKDAKEEMQVLADSSVKVLLRWVVERRGLLHQPIRSYIERICAVERDKEGRPEAGTFLVIAAGLTVALKPILVGEQETVTKAAKSFAVYILTIPLLTERLPPALLPALRHATCLEAMLQALQVPLQGLSHQAPEVLSHHSTDTPPRPLPAEAWALGNIVALVAGQKQQDNNLIQCFTKYIPLETYLTALATLLSSASAHELDLEKPLDGHFLEQLKLLWQPWHLVKASDNIPLFGAFYEILLQSKLGNPLHVLNALAFTPGVLKKLWGWLEIALGLQKVTAWDVLSVKTGVNGLKAETAGVLLVFCSAYAHLLLILDDEEFYEKQEPFLLDQHRKLAASLNTLVYNSFLSEAKAGRGSLKSNEQLLKAASRLLRSLYERDCRRSFCPPELWQAPAAASPPPVPLLARAHVQAVREEEDGEREEKDSQIPGLFSVLTVTPHVVAFEERVAVFRELVRADKVRGGYHYGEHRGGQGTGGIDVAIRRDHIIEDAFALLNRLGPRLKGRINVTFINQTSMQEAGLDYGGLFKEFLTDLAKAAFDPGYGLFAQTATEEGLLYPHAAAAVLGHGLPMLEFVGRIVGKALYDGVLLDYSFASIFVSKLVGRYCFLDELSSLDKDLYRNLMYLKHYEGDAADLALDFTVTEDLFGRTRVVELRPNGAEKAVTNDTKLQYVHAVADYHLNRRLKALTDAFVRGLSDLIAPAWLRLFNPREFNQLLSGSGADVDVSDLRAHTQYAGGYTDSSRPVKLFWEVLARLEPPDKCALLKFVTSCSRPPLLGFKHLVPPFTIQKVSCDSSIFAYIGGHDVDRLPSASTCYNTLKLPNYKRASTLREKLLYAVRSNTGFELS